VTTIDNQSWLNIHVYFVKCSNASQFVEFEEVGWWWHNQQPKQCVELLVGLWGFNYGGY